MIEDIESKGYYIDQCRIPGESKADECVPAQHNTIRLSADRWFVIYETRGFRGSDDNRSVIYQVRKDSPDGEVLTEGYLDKALQNWDPLGDGSDYVKLCNHSVAFGVPKGARIDGQYLAHAGHFVATWRANPRVLDRERDYLLHEEEVEVAPEAYRCYWIQFRLNETEDDIDITRPLAPLREKGYEEGEAVCRHPHMRAMNQSYVDPVPYNRDRSQWAFLLHWSVGVVASTSVCSVIRFQWNQELQRYEWVETGPILKGPEGMGIFEGAVLPYRDEWLVSARVLPRQYKGNMWFRTGDLFGPAPDPVFSEAVRSTCPRTSFLFPDGVVRVFTTDQVLSPYQQYSDVRIPLHALDIDPENDYAVTRSRVVFDSLKAGIPIPPEATPTNHFCRLLPHNGGNSGLLTYFVRPRSLKHQWTAGRNKGLLKEEEMHVSGVYYSEVTYDQDYPPMWEF